VCLGIHVFFRSRSLDFLQHPEALLKSLEVHHDANLLPLPGGI
jgi:hypothetical protein